MELLPRPEKAGISWRVYFESPVECAAQCLVRHEGIEHGGLLVISIPGFTPGVPGKRLIVSRHTSQGCEDGAGYAGHPFTKVIWCYQRVGLLPNRNMK